MQLGSLKVAGNPLEQPTLELVSSEDAKGTRQWCWEEFARREKARIRGAPAPVAGGSQRWRAAHRWLNWLT